MQGEQPRQRSSPMLERPQTRRPSWRRGRVYFQPFSLAAPDSCPYRLGGQRSHGSRMGSVCLVRDEQKNAEPEQENRKQESEYSQSLRGGWAALERQRYTCALRVLGC